MPIVAFLCSIKGPKGILNICKILQKRESKKDDRKVKSGVNTIKMYS